MHEAVYGGDSGARAWRMWRVEAVGCIIVAAVHATNSACAKASHGTKEHLSLYVSKARPSTVLQQSARSRPCTSNRAKTRALARGEYT